MDSIKERECIWCGDKFFPTSDDPDAGHCSVECFESEWLSHSDPEPMEIELEEKR